MQQIFVTHFKGLNQINQEYFRQQLLYIFAILLFIVVATLQKKEEYNKNDFLSRDTGDTLRGIAILLLIFGHLCIKCIDGYQFFEWAGRWAVIIFLYISGIALVKTYGLDSLSSSFILKRIRRLLIPTWLGLTIFYLLDFILLHKSYSFKHILLSVFCILRPTPPDGPAWFVTYIFVLYLFFFFVSRINLNNNLKPFIILVCSYLCFLIIAYVNIFNKFFIWMQYSSVFPLSVAIGIYRKNIKNILKRICSSKLLSIFLVMILFCQYYKEIGIYSIKHILSFWIYHQFITTLQPISMIILLTITTFLLDNSVIRSKFLIVLGKYSFEIFLIHMPFMVYYDFFLFRKPLSLWFIIYFLFIYILSFGINLASTRLNNVFGSILQRMTI